MPAARIDDTAQAAPSSPVAAFLTAIEASFHQACALRRGSLADLHEAGYGSFTAEFRLQHGRFVFVGCAVRITHQE